MITVFDIQVNAEATAVADEEQIKSKRPSRVESFRLFSYIILEGILFFYSLDCEMLKTRETHIKLKSVMSHHRKHDMFILNSHLSDILKLNRLDSDPVNRRILDQHILKL